MNRQGKIRKVDFLLQLARLSDEHSLAKVKKTENKNLISGILANKKQVIETFLVKVR